MTFEEFQITVDKIFTDDFNSWSVGQLEVLDKFDNLFDGSIKDFRLSLNGDSVSIQALVLVQRLKLTKHFLSLLMIHSKNQVKVMSLLVVAQLNFLKNKKLVILQKFFSTKVVEMLMLSLPMSLRQ